MLGVTSSVLAVQLYLLVSTWLHLDGSMTQGSKRGKTGSPDEYVLMRSTCIVSVLFVLLPIPL